MPSTFKIPLFSILLWVPSRRRIYNEHFLVSVDLFFWVLTVYILTTSAHFLFFSIDLVRVLVVIYSVLFVSNQWWLVQVLQREHVILWSLIFLSFVSLRVHVFNICLRYLSWLYWCFIEILYLSLMTAIVWSACCVLYVQSVGMCLLLK